MGHVAAYVEIDALDLDSGFQLANSSFSLANFWILASHWVMAGFWLLIGQCLDSGFSLANVVCLENFRFLSKSPDIYHFPNKEALYDS